MARSAVLELATLGLEGKGGKVMRYIFVFIFIFILTCLTKAIVAESQLPKCEFENKEFFITQNCYGKYLISNKNKYDGEWKHGKPDGKGTMTHKNGDIYIGEFKNGFKTG